MRPLSSQNVRMRRFPLILVCSVAALAVALSGSATASNGLSFGHNVDPSLVSTMSNARRRPEPRQRAVPRARLRCTRR